MNNPGTLNLKINPDIYIMMMMDIMHICRNFPHTYIQRTLRYCNTFPHIHSDIRPLRDLRWNVATLTYPVVGFRRRYPQFYIAYSLLRNTTLHGNRFTHDGYCWVSLVLLRLSAVLYLLRCHRIILDWANYTDKS